MAEGDDFNRTKTKFWDGVFKREDNLEDNIMGGILFVLCSKEKLFDACLDFFATSGRMNPAVRQMLEPLRGNVSFKFDKTLNELRGEARRIWFPDDMQLKTQYKPPEPMPGCSRALTQKMSPELESLSRDPRLSSGFQQLQFDHTYQIKTTDTKYNQKATTFHGSPRSNPDVKVDIRKLLNPEKTIEHAIDNVIWKTSSPEAVNVVHFMDWMRYKGDIYTVIQRPSATLQQVMTSSDPQWENFRKSAPKLAGILKDTVKGTEWLHQKGIVHKEISAENIFLYMAGDQVVAKVGDYGTSFVLGNEQQRENPDTDDSLKTEDFDFTRGKLENIFEIGKIFLPIFKNLEMPKGQPDAGLSGHIMYASDHLFHWTNQPEGEMDKRPTASQILNHPVFWKEEDILKFFKEISQSLNTKNAANIKSSIDKEFSGYYQNVVGSSFDWQNGRNGIHSGLLQTKKGPNDYNGSAVVSFVKFIRDKYEHKGEIDLTVRKLCFKELSTQTYMNYFLTKFPFVCMYLFAYTGKYGQSYDALKGLHEKFFKGFLNGTHYRGFDYWMANTQHKG